MIGKLSGRLEYRAADHVLIDVRGIGYLVYVSDRTLAAMPGPGEAVALFTELLVREDLLQLFGFPTLLEKEWHRLLMTVQGVGAKAAMAILGTLGAEGVSRAIALGDMNAIKAAPGVGPKIAQRVVLELKTKAPGLMAMSGTAAGTRTAVPSDEDVIEAARPPIVAPIVAPVEAPARRPGQRGVTEVPVSNASADALSALINLGYGQGDAAAAVAEAAGGDPAAGTAAGTAGLIRAALKLLAPKA